MQPERFATGIRKTTIPNPAVTFRNNPDATIYRGSPGLFDWRKQKLNYERLRAVLQSNGDDLLQVFAVRWPANEWAYGRTEFTRFVCTTASGALLWEKYENGSAGAGQNYVYVAQRRFLLSSFLGYTHAQQVLLLRGDRAELETCGMGNWGDDYLSWLKC
jgi:hypothetical protein